MFIAATPDWLAVWLVGGLAGTVSIDLLLGREREYFQQWIHD
jgi:hypothetical protein